MCDGVEQGLAAAVANVGFLLDKQGRLAEAMAWYTRAAEQGLPSAQYNLGVLLYKGRAAAPDCPRALYWYTILTF